MIRTLAWVACLLTVCITASSAFIRHSQSGVGCDGWPACYRDAFAQKTTSPTQHPQRAAPSASAPESGRAAPPDAAPSDAAPVVPRAVRLARALHRISAMAVGVLVLLIAVFGWASMRGGTRAALVVALADTFFLAWLGRLTPHELPLVTVGNLLGGLLLAGAFAWIAAASARDRAQPAGTASTAPSLRDLAATHRHVGAASPALAALLLLGGSAWVGTMIGAHGAIDACAASSCLEGAFLDAASLDPMRTAAPLDSGSARGLHLLHRGLGVAFALVVVVVAWRIRQWTAFASVLIAATLAQWLLGVGTALGTQPLVTTTAHNAVAAVLVVLLGAIASRATQGTVMRSGFAAQAPRAAHTADRVPRAP